jgi:hypothetical protein
VTGSFPWPDGSATGIGSLPGEDVGEAVRLVFGELPDLPHLPELPARGPGADLIGRAAALLVDMPVDLQPSGWRLVDRPGRDLRRSRDLLARDLDALEETADGYTGPLKVQAAGPWTLAGSVELHYGDKAVADPGAVRDLLQSLAEGLRRHVADVRRRVPGADVILQLDEPSLPAVLAGTVPTASGFGTLDPVQPPTAQTGLGDVLAAAGAYPVVHCCAAGAPIEMLRAAGARAVALDAALLPDDEALGEAVQAGTALWLGVVPTRPGSAAAGLALGPRANGSAPASTPGSGSGGGDPVLSDLAGTVGPVRRLWRRLGFAPELLPRSVVVTPACGLAGTSPAFAREALRRCREAGRALGDDPEG